MSEVTVNFVAFNDARDACVMVLIEEAWTGTVGAHLRALQERIYGCLDAALDGRLADQFPESAGKAIVVRIDCYDLPRSEVDAFVERFADGIRSVPDYSTATSPFVREFRFEVNHDTVAIEP